jgi:hypothetical protein
MGLLVLYWILLLRLLVGLWQKIVCFIMISDSAHMENILKSYDLKPYWIRAKNAGFNEGEVHDLGLIFKGV